MTRALLACALLIAAACHTTEPEQLLPLRIGGTVVSNSTGAPIPGATVSFGVTRTSGDDVLDTAQAGSDGAYLITHTVSVQRLTNCPVMWIRASAPGFATNAIDDTRVAVRCTATLQTVTVRLSPTP